MFKGIGYFGGEFHRLTLRGHNCSRTEYNRIYNTEMFEFKRRKKSCVKRIADSVKDDHGHFRWSWNSPIARREICKQ